MGRSYFCLVECIKFKLAGGRAVLQESPVEFGRFTDVENTFMSVHTNRRPEKSLRHKGSPEFTMTGERTIVMQHRGDVL